MDQIGLAIIGCGAVVTGRHLPALAAISGAQVCSIYDPDIEAARRVAARTGARIAAALEEAVQSKDVQAVVIASPNAFHRQGVEAAADAGKHILCEKPLATNLRDARAAQEAVRRAGVVLQLGFHHRFTSEFRLVRRLLEAGVIGAVHSFQATMSEPFDVTPGGSANYRLDPKLSGGLTLIDFGSHRIDQLRALAGDAREISACFTSAGGHGLDDNVVLLVAVQSGAIGALSFHRFSRGALARATLIGTKGVLCFNAYVTNPFHAAPVAVFTEEPLPPDVAAFTRPQDWWSPPRSGWIELWPPVVNPFIEEYKAFFGAVRSGRISAATGEDGYKALEIVMAAYKAHHARRAVALPLDPEEVIPPPTFTPAASA
jgi:predicted dehydrogenase